MRFLLGVAVGAVFMRFYSSRQGASAADQWSDIPDRVAEASRMAAAGVSSGAQRVAEMVDSAPIPEAIKTVAGDAAFSAWAAADAVASAQTGSSGGTEPKEKPAASA